VAARTRLLIGGAVVAAGASLAWLPLLWLGVGLVLMGVHASAPESVAGSAAEAATR